MPQFYPELHVRKMVKGKDVYYHLPWTPIKKADRYEVAKSVPALSGIFEIFYQNEKKNYILLTLEPAWYGGVQGKIRENIDYELQEDPVKRKILEDKPLFFRFVLTDCWPDIQDIMFYLIRKYRGGDVPGLESSGRYRQVYLKQDGL
ncbi:MAG: hypothetical protein A2Z96_05915 [Spirochaetes bacterium GWB1_48_6]|nr:MAG: hypothetical protein A2Z96_05915 [Spirochaetes bacterium GWB1_48_6]